MATDTHAEAKHPGYELKDASPRGLFIFLVCMAGFLLVMGLLVAWLFGYFDKHDIAPPAISQPFVNARPLPPAPLLQATPMIDIQQYEQSEQSLLKSYAWIDRQQGIVRIPIDRAMELLSQKGFPTRPQQGALTAKRAGARSGPASSQSAAESRSPSNSPSRSEVQP